MMKSGVAFTDPINGNVTSNLNVEKIAGPMEYSEEHLRIFSVSMSVNLFFGHIFSILVLRLAIKNQLKKPINIMICIDEGIKMVGYTWNNVVLIDSIPTCYYICVLVDFL